MAQLSSQLIIATPAQALMDQFTALTPEDQAAFLALLKQSSKPQSSKAATNKGVGEMCRTLIKQGLGNKEILDMICLQYGNANTTYACVAWYRNDMKQKGLI
jgi:hypothetical protein